MTLAIAAPPQELEAPTVTTKYVDDPSITTTEESTVGNSACTRGVAAAAVLVLATFLQ